MKGGAHPPLPPLERYLNLLRGLGLFMLAAPNLIAHFGFYSPLRQGPIIAALFFLPLIVFIPFAIWLRKPERFRISYAGALLFTVVLLTALSFLALAPSYLNPTGALFWELIVAEAILIAAGIIFGLLKHDPALLDKQQRTRHRVSCGRIRIYEKEEGGYGFRDTTGSKLLDRFLKAITRVYLAIVLVGMFLGGGAPYVILELLDPIVPPDNPLGKHVVGMLGLGMLALPGLGYLLPALFRQWRGLRRLEREALVGADGLVFEWIE